VETEKKYEAFEGVLNGGIIGTLLDCHCNWTAAYHLMKRAAKIARLARSRGIRHQTAPADTDERFGVSVCQGC
jgi:hypothetical protein